MLEQYGGAIGLLIAWFAYKQWRLQQLRRQLPELLSRQAEIIDVREAHEYEAGHLLNSKNIPMSRLTQSLTELPQDRPLLLCCASGTRSGMARMLLKRHGFQDVYNLGAWSSWKQLNQPREKV